MWWYGEDGEVLTRGGKPLPRPKGKGPPCGSCPKVPAGTESPGPEKAVELTAELRECYRFYRECRAVGAFPADPIVRWAAAVIRSAEDHCEKVQSHRTQLTVLSAVKNL